MIVRHQQTQTMRRKNAIDITTAAEAIAHERTPTETASLLWVSFGDGVDEPEDGLVAVTEAMKLSHAAMVAEGYVYVDCVVPVPT